MKVNYEWTDGNGEKRERYTYDSLEWLKQNVVNPALLFAKGITEIGIRLSAPDNYFGMQLQYVDVVSSNGVHSRLSE